MDDADQGLEGGIELLPYPVRGQNRTCRLTGKILIHHGRFIKITNP
jgi:hypothetical protein